jgi:hypothetical protein
VGGRGLDGAEVWQFLKFAVIPVVAWFLARAAARIERRWLRFAARACAYFVCAGSAVQLVLAIPSGSIDISDLWRFLGFCLMPLLPLLGIIVLRELRIRWLRISATALCSVLMIPASSFLLLLCLFDGSCTARTPPSYSPDAKHIALLEVTEGGALGPDYARVNLRGSWLPYSTKVFSGTGAVSEPGSGKFVLSPAVRWLDNYHLLIRYTDFGKPTPVCEKEAGSIKIICEDASVSDEP